MQWVDFGFYLKENGIRDEVFSRRVQSEPSLDWYLSTAFFFTFFITQNEDHKRVDILMLMQERHLALRIKEVAVLGSDIVVMCALLCVSLIVRTHQ